VAGCWENGSGSFLTGRVTVSFSRSLHHGVILNQEICRRSIRAMPHLVRDSAVHYFYDSSVVIALGYGLDDRGSRVRFPAGAGNFSLYHRIQNGSGAHPASYQMGTRGSFPVGKAAGT
jgi:hypothetical protein